MPWLKLQKDTKRNPCVRKMPLAQQAVFYNLLQHSGLQEPEGSFSADNPLLLALEVANEDAETLSATIDHLLLYGVLQRLDDGRLAFTNWELHQAVPPHITEKRSEAGQRGADARWHGEDNNQQAKKGKRITSHKPPRQGVAKMPDREEEGDRDKSKDDVKGGSGGKRPLSTSSTSSTSSSDNPLFVATNIHDDDPDGQTYRQTASILEVNGQYPVEKAVFAVLEQNRKRGFSNEALVFEAKQWASKLGKERKTPGARAASFREWMDTAFERGPPGNGKSLQDRVHKSTAEDRKILNDRYQKQFGRPAYPEDA